MQYKVPLDKKINAQKLAEEIAQYIVESANHISIKIENNLLYIDIGQITFADILRMVKTHNPHQEGIPFMAESPKPPAFHSLDWHGQIGGDTNGS